MKQRFRDVPEISNLADFPQRRRKRIRERVLLVMLVCIDIYIYICKVFQQNGGCPKKG